MANVDQKNLIPLCILEVLRKYSDPDHPLTHNMIADHLEEDYGISPRPERKSIGRNLENLKTQMDIDIEITPKGSYLVSREFEDYEIRLLIDLVLSNKYISTIETKELVKKLKGLSGAYFESYEDHLLTIDEKKKTDKRDLYLKLQLINDAIESGCDIRFVLDEEAEYPSWMSANDWLKVYAGTHDYSDGSGRNAQIKPEYLILMKDRYYVAFKAILMKNIGGDLTEELTYCRLDEMHDLSIVDHEPVVLPKGISLPEKVEVSEDAVREMVGRGVLEQHGINKLRVDFFIDPRLTKKAEEVLGEAFLITEYPDLIPQTRMIIDADRNTFERFWWDHLAEIRPLGPPFEITRLMYMLNAAIESISDAERLKKSLGIDNVVLDPNTGKRIDKRKKSGRPCPEKKILNKRIHSREYETEAHGPGMGDVIITCYDLTAELEIEDEGHIIFLHGEYNSMRYKEVYLWATTESLFSIEAENENIYGELAERYNTISEAGIEKCFPGTDPADRYSDMETCMLDILREQVKQDKRDDELSEDGIWWEPPYCEEKRTETFDIDKLFTDIDLQDLLEN